MAPAAIPLLPALLALIFFVGLLNPVPFLKDAGELAASLAGAGIAHPTGFPLLHQLAALLLPLPLGSSSFRLSLLSAVGAAVVVGAVVAVTWLVTNAAPREADRGGARTTIASRWTFLPLFVLPLALWSADNLSWHALNIEVYAPSLALSAVLLLIFHVGLSSAKPGYWRLFALLSGLGLGAHVTVPLGAGLLGALWLGAQGTGQPTGRRLILVARTALLAIPWALAGALVTIYLPLRASMEPLRNWGNPSSLTAFLGHLTGHSIRQAFDSAMFDQHRAWPHLALYGEQLVVQCGLLLLLAPVGLLVAARRGFSRTAVGLAALWLADALFSILINPMGIAERQTGALSLLVVFTSGAVGAAALVRSIPDFSSRSRPLVRTALFATAAVVLTILLVAAPVLSLTPAERTSRVGRHGYETGLRALRTTAPSGLLVTNSDDLSAQAIFLLETERRRPDLLAVVKQFVCDPAAMSPLLRRADAATHPAARLLRTIHEHHCHGEDRRAVANAWQALANQGDPATSDLSWQLGDAMADHHFFHLLRPGYPTFSSAAGIRGFSPQAWQELLDSLPREPLSDHLAAFNDDISRQSLADFFLLAGTALLRTAPPGSPLLQGACGLMIRATRLGPSDCRSRNNLAICLAAAGDPARAVQVADLALPDCDDHLPLHLTALRYHLLLRQEAKATEVLAIMENAFPADMLVERVGRLARELEPHRGGSLSGWLMEWIESRLGIRPSELPVAVP